MILEAIKESLNFPFKEQDWIKTILLGSVLALASLLVLPAPLLLGYLVRVMRQDSIPGFDNLLDMYIDGLKAFTVAVIYILPGIMLLGLFDGGIAILGFLIFLIGWWGFESGIYQLANNGFRQAFTKEALKTVFTLNYFLGVLASIILPILILITYGLSLILIVTLLLFPVVEFYTAVVRYRVIKNAIEA